MTGRPPTGDSAPLDAGEPILLNAYAAKQCAVRVQNDFSPLVPKLEWVPAPDVQAFLDAGNAFEREVFAALTALHLSAVVVDSRLVKAEAIAATLRAMDSRAPLVLNGWLPDDVDGGRTGRPDVLVRVSGGYLPADVKNHKTVKPTATTTTVMSPVASPDDWREVVGWSAAVGRYRFEDGMQLAHYTRMLQACGHHPGPELLRGAVLGTSRVATDGDDADWVFVWHDLQAPSVETFSRSSSTGRKRRSLLECYDHEHSFRLRVAETARREVDPPLVSPIGQNECDTCAYQQWCAQQMGPDEPSTAITKGRLDRREWLALRNLGVTTTEALATLDPDDPAFLEEYLPEVGLTPKQARKKLATAVERAEMICGGQPLKRRGDGPVDVPVADVEIDLDIENGLAGRVYMWGARVRRGTDESSARYVADFTEWAPIDAESERALAERFVAWLRAERAEAEAAGQTLRVFHWSHPEYSRLHAILGKPAVADLTHPDTGVFVDVEKVFKAQFTAVRGAGIKKVAPLFGFAWRVDDPGGAISQVYLATVHDSPDPAEAAAAQEWLLTYNEDDCAAMAAIRDGMRAWDRSDPNDRHVRRTVEGGDIGILGDDRQPP